MTANTMVHQRKSDLPASFERPQGALIHPVLDAQGVMQLHDAIAALVQGTLKEGQDYGVVPGTSGKPTLYKSGAERLCVGFGLVDTYEVIASETDHNFENPFEKRTKKGEVYASGTALGLYTYTVKCTLKRREDDQLVAEGVGYCSSLETKYMDRPRNVVNTILKMAKKRAKVDATLSGLGLSDRFTQDAEDGARATDDDDDDRGDPYTGSAPQQQRADRPANGEVRQPTDAERLAAMTLEHARTVPLRGQPTSWGGHGGKPLGEVPYSLILKAQEFFGKILKEKPGDKPTAYLVRALELVEYDQREHEAARAAAEKEATEGADMFKQAEGAAPAPAAAAKWMPNTIADGQPEDRAQWSDERLKAHAIHLLNHPGLQTIAHDARMRLSTLTHEQLAKSVVMYEGMVADETRAADIKAERAKQGRVGDLPGDPA